jgi:hypothetical protein
MKSPVARETTGLCEKGQKLMPILSERSPQDKLHWFEAAQDYIARGWSVIPLKPRDKRPLFPWKEYQTRLPTSKELAAWFEGTDNNIGIVAGNISNLTIVDCDSQEAIEFFESRDFVPTREVQTAKGKHYYYQYVPGSSNFQAKKEWPGIDLRSEGGYVVGPPSIHPSGKPYEWSNDLPIAVGPAWLFKKTEQARTEESEPSGTDDLFSPCHEGGRNMALTRLAGSLLPSNPLTRTLQICRMWNIQNAPPLADDELTRTVESVANKEAAKIEAWSAPIPLDDQPLPELPLGLFPEWFEFMIDSVALSTETPRELAAVLGLSALATSCQRTFEVELHEGYTEPTNLWINAAMESGNRKTAVLRPMVAPLIAYEREQAETEIPKKKKIESERKTQEGRIQYLRTQAAKGNSVDSVNVIQEIADLEAKLPEVPSITQLWAQDVTPEKLGSLMSAQGGVMSLISDEGGLFETFAGRYNNGIPNLDLLLKSHASSAVRIHRASSDPIDLPRPVLTIGVSPQPEVLRGLAQKQGFRGRGLLARFLYCLPQSQLGSRSLEPHSISQEIRDEYSRALQSLLKMEPPQDGPYRLKCTEGAHKVWREFALAVEPEHLPGGRFEHMQDWAGKLPGAAARVAGLLHCGIHAHGHPWGERITTATMEKALDFMAVLSEHALRAFAVMAANPDLEKAKKILSWIQRKGQKTFTQRDCHRDLQGSYPRVDDLKSGLDVLVERSIIRRVNPPRGESGRPSMKYEVNPQTLEEGA